MDATNFVYWLQGYAELAVNQNFITDVQWPIVKDHLNLVLKKETPERLVTQKDFEIAQRPGGGLYTTLPYFEPAHRLTNPTNSLTNLTC